MKLPHEQICFTWIALLILLFPSAVKYAMGLFYQVGLLACTFPVKPVVDKGQI